MIESAFRKRFERPILAMILTVTTLALLARLVVLGDRVAHYDEGRVAYDALRYLKTGTWTYDPSRHGPFLAQVNKRVFALLGPSDFSARLVVALVGGLLPLSAWLFRERLRDAELLFLATVFAVDPILLYYSRFLRNDILVATFSIVGFGLFVRVLNTGNRRYVYAGTVAFALAFTTKENAVLYPITILGGVALVFAHHLFLDYLGEGDPLGRTRGRVLSTLRGIWLYKGTLVGSLLLFVGLFVLFYAPRQPFPRAGIGIWGSVGLWEAVANPRYLPGVLRKSTIGTITYVDRYWIGGPFQKHPYLPYLGYLSLRLAVASWTVVGLAIVGYVADVWNFDRPNPLVSAGFYWGVASLIGYPLAMSVPASWTATHVIVPLAFPAAAGAAHIYRWGRKAPLEAKRRRAGVAALLLTTAVLYPVGMGIYTSFDSPQANVLVQYSQPADDMHPAIHAAQNASRHNVGLDVLWYGERFVVKNESLAYVLGFPNRHWYNRLPLPWYFEIANASVQSIAGDVPRGLGSNRGLDTNQPPVVVTCADGFGCPDGSERSRLASQLSGYVQFPHYEGRYASDGTVFKYVFFVQERYVPGRDVSREAESTR